jgi:hypothetical protein
MKILKIIVIIFLLITCFESYGQKKVEQSEIETKLFLKQFFNNDSLTYYIKEVGQAENCGKIDPNSFISEKEANYINSLLLNKEKSIYKISPLPNVKIILDKEFYKIDKDKILKDENLRILIISKPIFIRKNNYCIFYHKDFWGNLGGSDQLCLYEKVNGIWSKKSEFCGSIN